MHEGVSHAQLAAGRGLAGQVQVVEFQGQVEVSPAAAAGWVPARTNQMLQPFDRLRTGSNSRVALRWSEQSVVPFGALTELEVLPPDSADSESGLHLVRGIISFFHRDKPGRIRIMTPGAVAGVDGTEFVMSVDDADNTTLSVLDGRVSFTNEQGALELTNGQQAAAGPGRAPVRTAGFVANNILQWCFYYPAVLDPADLPMTAAEQQLLAQSLRAYQAGDLPAALTNYPAGRQPGSDAERIYYAALLLSVGEAGPAQTALDGLTDTDASGRPRRLASALRALISAVKRQSDPDSISPQLATELLAGSYYEQSLAVRGASLKSALDLARQAANVSPQFSFAWERVAELEFGFGHTAAAQEALDKSLALAPRNAQGLALKGFLLAAQNRPGEAITWFDRALAVDSTLGNAWLGRGLCRIRRGDLSGGRGDLLLAAALEPQRAELRSYLGKAYADAGDEPHAAKEFRLAEQLDTNDPTAWLYSALFNQENRRINEAIQDAEKSGELNDNRRVYRSQLLLDQDQAVRSANLAAMYRDAGMFDVSVDEAARAVSYDYANYSAHLFLANSYDQLRDPNEINLRYETPEEAEFLVANLLAPPGAGTLSSTISQQEYSRLFERDGFGVASETEYLSRGAWTESGAQYGTFGNYSYNFGVFYHSDPGQRPDNDIYQRQLSLGLKQQLTPRDSLYLVAQQYDAFGGDNFEYYQQSQASTNSHFNEKQDPILGLGYHHEWGPGSHTLVFVTRLQDTYSLTNTAQPTLLANWPDINEVNPTGIDYLQAVQGLNMSTGYREELAVYSGELQQILEGAGHTTVLGGRFQYGEFHTDNVQDSPSEDGGVFTPPTIGSAAAQDVTPRFRRLSFYGYHQWQILDSLQLTGGVTYDWITYPENFETMPVSANETSVEGVSPKAGLIWTPSRDTTVRFAYTQSISGASIDQSYQIEPAQVAGFVQSFRSIIPESVVGPTPGSKFETFDLSLEQKLRTGTYMVLSGEILNSRDGRTIGAFGNFPDNTNFNFAIPSSLSENLDYEERTFQFNLNQLVGREWSFGLNYRLSDAVLHINFPQVTNGVSVNDFLPRERLEGVLNRLDLTAYYNHPKGFFAEGEALWQGQDNLGYSPDEPGDAFWQFNVLAGYRSPRRRVEAAVALLNIANQDYNLNPLNLYNELPRRRTLAVRLGLNF